VPETHFVAVHAPGPHWDRAVTMREQIGLQDHVEHYRRLLQAGTLVLGGPFSDEASGGMMVFASSVTESEAREHAAADPAVQSGLLTCDVRAWVWVFKA
jgi:uncharacterized protein YciI